MVKCKYCDKEANNHFRYLGIWMCEKHARIYEEKRFEKMIKRNESFEDDVLNEFENELKT